MLMVAFRFFALLMRCRKKGMRARFRTYCFNTKMLIQISYSLMRLLSEIQHTELNIVRVINFLPKAKLRGRHTLIMKGFKN